MPCCDAYCCASSVFDVVSSCLSHNSKVHIESRLNHYGAWWRRDCEEAASERFEGSKQPPKRVPAKSTTNAVDAQVLILQWLDSDQDPVNVANICTSNGVDSMRKSIESSQ